MILQNDIKIIPVPSETRSYKPVRHGDFIDSILEVADKHSLVLRREDYDTAKTGNIIRGVFAFMGEDSAMDMQVGIVNSYDKTKTAMIGIGSQVFICQNGMISAEFIMKRKHTGSVVEDLNSMIRSSFDSLHDEYLRNIEIRDRFKEMEINKRFYAELIGRMYLEEGIFTATQLGIVKSEFNESKLFPEPTVWSIYNHANHALKSSHPSDYINQHINLHKFMLNEFS